MHKKCGYWLSNRLKLGGLPFNTIIGACGGSVTYEMKH